MADKKPICEKSIFSALISGKTIFAGEKEYKYIENNVYVKALSDSSQGTKYVWMRIGDSISLVTFLQKQMSEEEKIQNIFNWSMRK